MCILKEYKMLRDDEKVYVVHVYEKQQRAKDWRWQLVRTEGAFSTMDNARIYIEETYDWGSDWFGSNRNVLVSPLRTSRFHIALMTIDTLLVHMR